jgi:hypothetical protein
VPPQAGGAFVFTPTAGTIFLDYFLNGPPEATGIFMVDLTSISFILTGNGTIGATNTIQVAVGEGGNVYVSPIYLNNFYTPTGTLFPVSGNLGQIYIDVTAARAAGVTAPAYWRIINDTNGTLSLSSYGSAFAQYYPLGLQ